MTTDHTRDTRSHGAHPSQLALELFLHQAHEPRELAAITLHLETCAPCRAQLDAMRGFDASPHGMPANLDALLDGAAPSVATRQAGVAPPARRTHPTASSPRDSWKRAAKPLLLLAIASAALFALTHTSSLRGALDLSSPLDPDAHLQPTDVVRRKAATFRLDVFVHNGEQARLAIEGEEVYPGERVGFQISASRAGYLLVAGRDEASNTYLGYPQDLEGQALLMEGVVMGQPLKLDQALLLDDVLGTEKIAAMYCTHPFSFEEIEPLLTHEARHPAPPLREGCVMQTLTLHKIAPPTDR